MLDTHYLPPELDAEYILRDIVARTISSARPAVFKKILLASDGSEQSYGAIVHGIAFARQIGAEVVGLHAIKPFSALLFNEPVPSDILTSKCHAEVTHHMATPILNRVKRTATRQGVRCTVVSVEAASPARTIIAVAEKTGRDLIIMASHGRDRLARFLFGSETTHVLAQCKIPVLVYR